MILSCTHTRKVCGNNHGRVCITEKCNGSEMHNVKRLQWESNSKWKSAMEIKHYIVGFHKKDLSCMWITGLENLLSTLRHLVGILTVAFCTCDGMVTVVRVSANLLQSLVPSPATQVHTRFICIQSRSAPLVQQVIQLLVSFVLGRSTYHYSLQQIPLSSYSSILHSRALSFAI